MQAAALQQTRDKPRQILRSKKGGRPPAQVQLRNLRLRTHHLLVQLPLCQQAVDIASLHPVVFGDPGIAGTIGTQAFAIGQVHIETDALLFITLIEGLFHCRLPVDY